MSSIRAFFRGSIKMEVHGAEPEWALNRLMQAQVAFWDVEWIDAFSLRLRLFYTDAARAEKAVEAGMCHCKQVEAQGLRSILGQMRSRGVLVFMVILSATLVYLLPRFVFFYSVSGNERIADEKILRALEEVGISVGEYGPNIEPLWVKNHVLDLIPELQWITVTQNGCKANVVVRERDATPETADRKTLANVIAAQSGIITEQFILAGQALYDVGDTVTKGDLLVSGIVDLERVFTIEHAKAEIYARTWRTQRLIIPVLHQEKEYTEETWNCIWLEIGGCRIKIFGNSGISTTTCDKITVRKQLTLPGELSLPISVVVETFKSYKLQEAAITRKAADEILTESVVRSVQQQMQAGEILEHTAQLTKEDGCYQLMSTLECHEMIARSVEGIWNNEE